MALREGQYAPEFMLKSHLEQVVSLSDYRGKMNVVIAFFPLAWTPIWTAQIPSYQVALDRFDGFNTQVLGISVDSHHCLRAWAESLGGITYPLLSDFYPHGKTAQSYGVLRAEGFSERAIFVIDKTGRIRYVDVHQIDLQPVNEELFGVLADIEPFGKPVIQIEPIASSEPKADVVMYCTPWCPGCSRARAFLQERGIPFVEINIARDRAAAARVREWTGGNETTPTFNIKGKIIIDYNKFQLAAALGINP